MRWLLLSLIVVVVSSYPFWNMAPEQHPVPMLTAEDLVDYVFYASHQRYLEPCVSVIPDLFPDAKAIQIVDSVKDCFKLPKEVPGLLQTKYIAVRNGSVFSESYPRKLIPGTLYKLRLTPSSSTRQQISHGTKTLRIDAYEIAEEIEDTRPK